jgi:hypothetical protein
VTITGKLGRFGSALVYPSIYIKISSMRRFGAHNTVYERPQRGETVTYHRCSRMKKLLITCAFAAAIAAGASDQEIPDEFAGTIEIKPGVTLKQFRKDIQDVIDALNMVEGSTTKRAGCTLCLYRPARDHPPHSHQYLGAGRACRRCTVFESTSKRQV